VLKKARRGPSAGGEKRTREGWWGEFSGVTETDDGRGNGREDAEEGRRDSEESNRT